MEEEKGSDTREDSPDASGVKVVDRRWWAREGAGDETTADWELRKPTYLEELERQLADKNELLQSYMTQHKQAVNEFEEARARMRRDIAKDVERGRRATLGELLEVLDNLERATAAGHQSVNVDALREGIDLVVRQFVTKLESFGVRRIDALGQPFDPGRHEAVSTVPTTDPDQDGIVVGIIAPGYMIAGDVLRPAIVAVARVSDGDRR